ncbi:LLM class flavin-dependent oxidoreductase [Actinomadura viridis]|uniref:LLM class flavin-dependent oxidoreductase n=1 Tax=Actinomadura viridis TaxID=58110 RepID=UPI00367CD6A6
MTAPRFLITLPTAPGTGRDPRAAAPLPPFVTDPRRGRYGPFDHLAEAGRAAEMAAFDGVVAPFAPEGEESLVTVAALLRQSRWLSGVAGFHPAITTPVYAAKLSASLQRFSGGRLAWWPVVDLAPAVARAQGDFLEGPDRYARAGEFLTVAKGVWDSEDYTYEGRFFQVLAGGFQGPLSGRPFPAVYLSGASAEALDLSARHADVHVFETTDEAALDAGIAELDARAAERDRAPARALRLRVVAREDGEEARAHARALEGPALAGSYEEVAEALRGYAARGIGAFVLEARPHLEETYRLGEHLLPLLAEEFAHAD